jgi:hypothetical protein
MFAECMASGTLDRTGYREMLAARGKESADMAASEAAFGEL